MRPPRPARSLAVAQQDRQKTLTVAARDCEPARLMVPRGHHQWSHPAATLALHKGRRALQRVPLTIGQLAAGIGAVSARCAVVPKEFAADAAFVLVRPRRVLALLPAALVARVSLAFFRAVVGVAPVATTRQERLAAVLARLLAGISEEVVRADGCAIGHGVTVS